MWASERIDSTSSERAQSRCGKRRAVLASRWGISASSRATEPTACSRTCSDGPARLGGRTRECGRGRAGARRDVQGSACGAGAHRARAVGGEEGELRAKLCERRRLPQQQSHKRLGEASTHDLGAFRRLVREAEGRASTAAVRTRECWCARAGRSARASIAQCGSMCSASTSLSCTQSEHAACRGGRGMNSSRARGGESGKRFAPLQRLRSDRPPPLH